jgi:hypothetical protein
MARSLIPLLHILQRDMKGVPLSNPLPSTGSRVPGRGWQRGPGMAGRLLRAPQLAQADPQRRNQELGQHALLSPRRASECRHFFTPHLKC